MWQHHVRKCCLVLAALVTPALAGGSAAATEPPKGPFEPTWESIENNY